MSPIPPYQMSAPPGGPSPKQANKNVWIMILVAMLVLCGVCGVVGAAVVLPLVAKGRILGREAVALSHAKTIAVATSMYAADHDDRFPPIKDGPSVTGSIEKYFDGVGQAGRSQRTRDAIKKTSSEYVWNTGLSCVEEASVKNINDVWLFHSTPTPDLKRPVIGLAVGRAKRINPEEMDGYTSVKPIIEKPKK